MGGTVPAGKYPPEIAVPADQLDRQHKTNCAGADPLGDDLRQGGGMFMAPVHGRTLPNQRYGIWALAVEFA